MEEEEEIYDDIDVQCTSGVVDNGQDDTQQGMVYTGLLSQSNDNVYDIANETSCLSRPQSGVDYKYSQRVNYRPPLPPEKELHSNVHASFHQSNFSINFDVQEEVNKLNKQNEPADIDSTHSVDSQEVIREAGHSNTNHKSKFLHFMMIVLCFLSLAILTITIVQLVLWQGEMREYRAQLERLTEQFDNDNMTQATCLSSPIQCQGCASCPAVNGSNCTNVISCCYNN